jgi:hypothetical protein
MGKVTRQQDKVDATTFAEIILDGLRHNTVLQHMRLNECRPLTQTAMDALLDIFATKSNSTIRKVKAEFQEDIDPCRSDLVLACNRG